MEILVSQISLSTHKQWTILSIDGFFCFHQAILRRKNQTMTPTDPNVNPATFMSRQVESSRVFFYDEPGPGDFEVTGASDLEDQF